MSKFILLAALIGLFLSVNYVFPGDAPADSRLLFHIERSTNANKAYYYLSADSAGTIDRKSPVNAFWIMWAKDSTGRTREPLTPFEKKMAYGYAVKSDTSGKFAYVMRLSAFPDRPIGLRVHAGVAVAEIAIEGHPARLEKIYVEAEKGRVIPKVKYVELFGTALDTRQKVSEKVFPR